MWFNLKFIKNFGYDKLFSKELFSVAAKAIALDEAPAKFIILNQKFQIVFWNNRDEQSLGYKEKEVLGKIPDFLFYNGYRMTFIELLNIWKTQGMMNVRDLELGVVSKAGKKFPVEVTFVSRKILEDFYLLIIIRDITARKNIEFNYQKELELYKHGEKVGHFGSWYWDVVENSVLISDGFRNIFQVDVEDEAAEYFLKRVHPEDRGMVQETIKKAFDTSSDYEIKSYRIITQELQWKPITCIAEAKLNENGKLIAFLGFIKFIDQ